jgi:hypothetical protein
MKQEAKQARGKILPSIAAGLAATALVAFGVRAQEGGTLATLDVSLGGTYEFNDPGDNEGRLTQRLGFDVRSVTRTQSFGISADGEFILDGDGYRFERPGLALDYGRETRSTAFDVGLSYSIRDVEGSVDVLDPITGDPIDLVDDDGTLESLSLNAGLETGRDARFGTNTRFSYTERTYSDTSDPDLTDLTSWQIATTLRFDIDPRITLRTDASHRVTQEDNAARTESRTTRFGIGGDLLIDPLWSATFVLDYSIFETEEDVLGTRVLTEEDGVGFSLGITRQFRDGTLGMSLERNVSDDGAQDSLRVSRDREFSNGGELSWSLGLISFPNGDTAPVAAASYSMPTPRGGFSASLQQSASTSGGESLVSTSIGLDYNQAINAVSGWSVNGSLSSVDNLDDDTGDQARAEVGLAYNHALTRDWDLSASIRHRVTYENSQRNDSASILSLSLQRSFSYRP